MDKISESMKSLIHKIIPIEKKTINSIEIEEEVLLDIEEFAKSNYPKEFVAVLEGKIIKDILKVTGLLYQPFFSSRASATTKINLPINSNAVGTVHSHPSGHSNPSSQDLIFFGKSGHIHLIISFPFIAESLYCYDTSGNQLNYKIIR